METINDIEKTYQNLKTQGVSAYRLFEANPTKAGVIFPLDIIKDIYNVALTDPVYEPDPKGLLSARVAIAKYYKNKGLEVSSEQVLITSGSSETFFYLFKLLCLPGEAILAPRPSYPLLDQIGALANIKIETYDLDEKNNWQPNLDFTKEKPPNHIKAIVLVSPHNPTGGVLSKNVMEQIADWANRHNLALICDEVFSEFIFDLDDQSGRAEFKVENCFTLNGLSKMLALPGFKLSWVVVTGSEQNVQKNVAQLELMSDTFLTCHTAIQRALPNLLRDSGQFLSHYQKEVVLRRDLTLKLFRENGVFASTPAGGFYMSLRLEGHKSDEEIVIELLKKEALFVHPGYFYDFNDSRHVVISFLHKKEMIQKWIPILSRYLR